MDAIVGRLKLNSNNEQWIHCIEVANYNNSQSIDEEETSCWYYIKWSVGFKSRFCSSPFWSVCDLWAIRWPLDGGIGATARFRFPISLRRIQIPEVTTGNSGSHRPRCPERIHVGEMTDIRSDVCRILSTPLFFERFKRRAYAASRPACTVDNLPLPPLENQSSETGQGAFFVIRPNRSAATRPNTWPI